MKSVNNSVVAGSVDGETLADCPLLVFSGKTEQPLFGEWAGQVPVGQKRVEVTFEDATRGVIVTGMTGTGKTVSVMEPALKALLDAHCSGVVLTTKDADLGLADDYPDQVVVLGGSEMAEPVNLIGNMSLHTLKAFLDGLRMQLNSREPYWGSRGVVYAQFVVETLRLMGENPSLATIHDMLVEPALFAEKFDPWVAKQVALPEQYRTLLDAVLRDPFSLLVVGRSKHTPDDVDPRDDAPKQYGWQTMHLLPMLQPFAADQRLRKRLCDPDAPGLDMESLIYEQRKVVLTDIPEHVFGAAGRVVNELLRVAMRNAVLGYERHRHEGYGRDRFTFMVIDEFQHHVSLDRNAAARGLFDDNAWFDRSREYGHINLVAVQGVSSLAAKVPESESRSALASLLQNLGTTVGFATHDPETVRHLQAHVLGAGAQAVHEIVSGHLRRGEALVVSHELSRHDGSVVAHVASGAIHGAPHMAYGLRRGERVVPAGRFRPIEGATVKNPLAASQAYHANWSRWFEKARAPMQHAVAGVLNGAPVRSPMHQRQKPDLVGRSTWLATELDPAGRVRIGLQRVSKEAAWGLTVPARAIYALQAEVTREGTLDGELPKGGGMVPSERTAGWSVKEPSAFDHDANYWLEHEGGARIAMSQDDWAWLCQAARAWWSVIEEVSSALADETDGQELPESGDLPEGPDQDGD